MYAAEYDVFCLRPGCCLLGQLEGISGYIRELDDLITLIMMPEDEQIVAQLCLEFADTLDKVGIGGRRQASRAFNPPFTGGIGLIPEEEQCQRSGFWLNEGRHRPILTPTAGIRQSARELPI